MKNIVIFLIALLIVMAILIGSSSAFRMSRPPTLSHPITQGQVNQLNTSLDDLFNLTNGLISLDVVTTSKTNSTNGDIWILNDSGTFKLEFKAGDAVRTITP